MFELYRLESNPAESPMFVHRVLKMTRLIRRPNLQAHLRQRMRHRCLEVMLHSADLPDSAQKGRRHWPDWVTMVTMKKRTRVIRMTSLLLGHLHNLGSTEQVRMRLETWGRRYERQKGKVLGQSLSAIEL